MDAGQSSPPLLFDEFLVDLRRRGFTIGVEHHLRLQQLLPSISGRSPEDLRSLLCPLFATNEKQQAAFYDAFDSFLSLLSVQSPSIEASETQIGPNRPATGLRHERSKTKKAFFISGAIGLFAILIAMAVLKSYITPSSEAPPRETNSPASSLPTPPGPGKHHSTVIHSIGKTETVVEPANEGLPETNHEIAPLPELSLFERLLLQLISWVARFPFDTAAVVHIFGPILFFVAYEGYRLSQRRLVLHKQTGRKPPYSWPIRVQGRAGSVYDSPQFPTVARRLHSRQAAESYHLDVDASVRATAGSLGYARLRYRSDTRLSEYVLLIDRVSGRDHQAALFAQLAEALHGQGLFVHRYFFDADPRVCWNANAGTPIPLSELQSRHSEHRLLLFGDADRLTDPITGRIAGLANAFSVWNDRAILTPIPIASWGARERTLAGQFVVLPATTEALVALIEFFGGAESRADHDGVSHNRASLEAQIPATELVGFLRRDLEPGLFLWVCACAVYPELHWDLTLHFASLPCMPADLVTEANLLCLVGLPWFRAGFIPDELRWELIQELKPDQERDVRRAIIGLLETNPADERSFASETQLLEIAISRYRVAKSRQERRVARELLQSATASGSYGEYVALRSLESIQTSPLDFLLPRQLRRAFYRNGLSVFGLRTIVRLVLTLTLVMIGYGSWLWVGSANKELESEALKAAASVPAAEVTGANVASLDSLQRLETLRQLLVVLTRYERDGVPWNLRLRLYDVIDLYLKVRALYFTSFHKLLLGQTQSTLLSTLQQLPSTPGPAYAPTYQTLKAYLITTSNHEKSTQLFLSPTLLDRWSAGRNIDQDRLALAQKQFDFYSEELKAANPFSSENDTLAVERARAYLNRFGGQDSVYQYMLAEAEKASHPLNFHQVFPAAAQAVVDRKVVPGAFSKPGWVFMQNAFRDPTRFFSGERWVMGDQGTTGLDAAAIDQLRKRYQNDYIQQWREFIKSGAVLRYTSLRDANDKLRLLSGPQSPLLQLFSLVSKNTSVGLPDVDNMFHASQALVPPPGDVLAGPANQPYMSGLVGLQNAIDPFASQPGVPSGAAVAQITQQEQGAKGKVGEMALYFGNDPERGTVRKLLEAPITNVDPLLDAQAAARSPFISQILRLTSDLQSGKVKLDADRPVDLQDGQYANEALGLGKHTLEITSGSVKTNIGFGTGQGRMPVLTETPTAQEVKAVVLTSFQNQAHIQTTYAPVKVSVDNQDYGEAGANGIDIPNLPAGSHEVVLTEGNTAHKLSLTNGPSPTIDVRLDSDRNVGSVLILTPGLDDVQVMLDGKRLRKKSKSGQVRINLAVKQHTIRVSKEGFQEEPEQTVDIKKGEEVTLRFQLRANPTVAVLAINGATPGAQVKVDQRPAGTIETGGSLSVPDISPGNHTIEIAGYMPITKSFKAGETVTVAQSDLVPQVTKVAVKLLVTPANATITYKGPDGRTHETHPPTVELEEGQYTFTAAAASRSPESIVVAIGPGKANVVTLNLTSPDVQPKPSAVTMETWAAQSGWKLENGWYVHRGGGLVLYPVQPSEGTFVFSARRQGGVLNHAIEWAVGCLDNTSDYIRFGIDKKSIHRAAIVAGIKQKEESEPLKLPAKELEFTLRIDISAAGVTTYVQGNGGWEKIDSWPASSFNPANGKFGFYLPGTDEVYISNFAFTPK